MVDLIRQVYYYQKFSQADVVTMLVGSVMFSPSYSPKIESQIKKNVEPRKQSKRERVVAELASSDLTAQAVERTDIEYGSHEETPRGQHVASIRAIRQKGDKTR